MIAGVVAGFNSTKVTGVSCADEKVVIETETANVGNTYSGKEVVQIYVTCTEILFADVILSIILRIRFFPEKWLRL